jgi:hypothetical protein
MNPFLSESNRFPAEFADTKPRQFAPQVVSPESLTAEPTAYAETPLRISRGGGSS